MKLKLSLFAIWVLCMVAGAVAALRMLVVVFYNTDRAWALARAFDRVGNAALNGKDTETISSRANRSREEGTKWGCVLCKLLDKIEKDHCKNANGI